MTKAAQNLHVTQPTLSRQIAQLEEELGVKLFQRSNHHIILTEDGMILKRRAQEIVALAEKTKTDLNHGDEVLTGEISIGSGEFQSTAFLSDRMHAFHEKHPLVKYSIYSGNAQNIKDQIERGLLDMGLVSEPVDITKYDFISIDQKETWGVLVQENSDLADKEFVTPEDIKHRALLISSNENVKLMICKWLGISIDDLNIIAGYNLMYNGAVLVAKGIGIAFGIALNCTYQNCKFIPLFPALKAGTALVWKKNQIFSRAATAFIEDAKKCVKSISDNAI